MKKLLLFTMIIAITSCLNMGRAQIDSGNFLQPVWQCNFESPCPQLIIHTDDSSNLWQTGIPQKTFFSAAHSPLRALLTDTANTYPKANHSYFDFVISYPYEYINPLISFYHKWDMDSMTEGGWIEISQDNGLSWKNVVYDSTSMYILPNTLNMYSQQDTIPGGIPAFTGHSDGWVLTQFQWIWWVPVKDEEKSMGDTIWLRFHFMSDTSETNKDGWMIDDLRLDNVTYLGGMDSKDARLSLKLFPNPAGDFLWIENNSNQRFTASIFSNDGRTMQQFSSSGDRYTKVPLRDLAPGLYWIRAINHEGVPLCLKFVKQ